MKSIIRKILKIMLIAIGVIIAFVVIYMIAALSLSHIVIKKKATNEPENIVVYLLSNGVHTDIVLPVKTGITDWSKQFNYKDTRKADSSYHYIGIGWGDKGFYLETPTWNDLTVRVALRAGLGIDGTAVHATYYKYINEHDDLCRKFTISESQYKLMVQFIMKHLKLDEQGKAINIKTNAVYGDSDAFYEAYGRYSIFHTCNTWTNNLLKHSGQRACVWTPFHIGILHLYPKS